MPLKSGLTVSCNLARELFTTIYFWPVMLNMNIFQKDITYRPRTEYFKILPAEQNTPNESEQCSNSGTVTILNRKNRES
jgi:hypothetical protein